MKIDFEAYNEVFSQLKHEGVKMSAARKGLKFNFLGIQCVQINKYKLKIS